jgi:hypothetical protein
MINDNPNLPNFITREQEDKWKQRGQKNTEAGAKSKQSSQISNPNLSLHGKNC